MVHLNIFSLLGNEPWQNYFCEVQFFIYFWCTGRSSLSTHVYAISERASPKGTDERNRSLNRLRSSFVGIAQSSTREPLKWVLHVQEEENNEGILTCAFVYQYNAVFFRTNQNFFHFIPRKPLLSFFLYNQPWWSGWPSSLTDTRRLLIAPLPVHTHKSHN